MSWYSASTNNLPLNELPASNDKKMKQVKKSIPPLDKMVKFQHLLSDGDFQLLEQELDKPLNPGIRLNRIKCHPVTIDELVSRYNWEIKPVPYCASGWKVCKSDKPVSQSVEQRFGYYYIQDTASMLPPELFNFSGNPSPLILDMAASPGGKTTHLADRSGDFGLIVANDNSRERITALKLILQNWGVLNHAITQFPGEMFGEWFPEVFDYVLLDAPCSMQGLRTTASHPIRPVTDKEINSLSQRQVRLLTSALQTARVGGQVVYATCTLQPEEDEAVLDALLKKFPGLFSVVNLEKILPIPSPALPGDGTRMFHPSVLNAARLWPHRYGTSGFFCALLRKEGPFPPLTGAPSRLSNLQENGYFPIKAKERRVLTDFCLQIYGYDLDASLHRFNLEIWLRDKTCYAFPQKYFNHGFQFPIRSMGLQLGEYSPDGFIISHDWVSRFFDLFIHRRYLLQPEEENSWLKGLDIRGNPGTSHPHGTILIMTGQHDRFLGRGEIQRDRIKNLIPRRSILQ